MGARRDAVARWKRRVAAGWACTLLAVGGLSAIREAGRALVARDADGHGFVERWRDVASPPQERLARAVGAAGSRIVAALAPAPPRECWVRPRLAANDEHATLIDLQFARSLHHVFYPATFDPLPPGVAPAAESGRWVLDLDVENALVLPAGFVRVSATRRFALWRPAEPPR